MNHFLSFIYGDYDNFPIENYKNSKKLYYNEKYEKLKFHFNSLGFENVRFSQSFEINENPNDRFFYFITDIIDFEINNNIHEWDKVLIKKECMDSIMNNDNCYLIFLHENNDIKQFLSTKIDLFASADVIV